MNNKFYLKKQFILLIIFFWPITIIAKENLPTADNKAEKNAMSFPAGSDPQAEQRPFYRACEMPHLVSNEMKKMTHLMKNYVSSKSCYWIWEELFFMTELGWADADIVDISPLEGLEHLESLYLYGNQIKDITPLIHLKNLRSLRLDRNQISNLQPLSELTNLVHLFLNGNHIKDISPLQSLTQLKTLYLHNNQISDLTPLIALKKLEVLTLTNNPIDKNQCPVGKQVPKELNSFCEAYRSQTATDG